MSDALPEIVQRYLQAYNSLDVDGLLATVTDDIVFENLSNTSEPTRTSGKAPLRALARRTAQVFSSRRQVVTEAVVSADHVAILIEFEATVARDLPNGWKAGQQLKLRGASFFALRGGLIAKVTDLS